MIKVEKTYTANVVVVVDVDEFKKCDGRTVSVNGWHGYAIPVTTVGGQVGSLIFVSIVQPDNLNKRF